MPRVPKGGVAPHYSPRTRLSAMADGPPSPPCAPCPVGRDGRCHPMLSDSTGATGHREQSIYPWATTGQAGGTWGCDSGLHAPPPHGMRTPHATWHEMCTVRACTRYVRWELGWLGVRYIPKVYPRSALAHPKPDSGPGRGPQKPCFPGFREGAVAQRNGRTRGWHAA